MDAYDDVITITQDKDTDEISKKRDKEYDEKVLWIRTMKRKIRNSVGEVSVAPSTSSSIRGSTTSEHPRKGHLEKIPLPRFSGKPGEFGNFKKVFIELTKGEGYTPVLLIQQLRTKIPVEAVELIEGVELVEEAWSRLTKQYGGEN